MSVQALHSDRYCSQLGLPEAKWLLIEIKKEVGQESLLRVGSEQSGVVKCEGFFKKIQGVRIVF